MSNKKQKNVIFVQRIHYRQQYIQRIHYRQQYI